MEKIKKLLADSIHLALALGVIISLQSCIPVDAKNEVTLVTNATPEVNLAEGALKTFTVRLASAPKSDVKVNTTSSNPGVLSVAPPTLTFGKNNWNVDQTIVMIAEENTVIGNNTVNFAIGAKKSNQVFGTVNISDNDNGAGNVVAILPSATTMVRGYEMYIDEGVPAVLPVRLSAQPSGDVTVTYGQYASAALISPASLTFTPDNWNVNQNFSLLSPQDEDSENFRFNLYLSSTNLGQVTVMVGSRDDEGLQVVLSTHSLIVTKGQTTTMEVSLSRAPTGTTEIFISHSNPLIASASPYSFIFTPENWNVPQVINVTGKILTEEEEPASLEIFSHIGENVLAQNVWITVKE